jgi:DNA-binding NarL/FixJ family response regulator
VSAVLLAAWLVSVKTCICAPCRQIISAFEQAPPDPSAMARARREWHLDDTDVVLLRGVSGGQTNAQIGLAMAYSPKTIRNKLSVIYGKLGVSGRTEATLRASQLGLVA